MFIDALQDLATVYTIAYSKDAFGQQAKDETELYTNIPIRLHTNSNQFTVGLDIGKEEVYMEKWTMLALPEHNGASRGDKVVISGKTYIIVQKQEIRGRGNTISHVVYTLQEKK